MTLRLRVRIIGPAIDKVVDLRVPQGTTWETLRARLASLGPDFADWLDLRPCVEGVELEAHMLVGESPLVDGAFIEPARNHAPRTALECVVTDGPAIGTRWPLRPGTLTLGRGHGLVGEDSAASRRHARIVYERGEVLVEDLHSVNGTLIDGESAVGPRPWRVGQHLRIGATELILETPHDGSFGSPAGAATLLTDVSPSQSRFERVEVDWPSLQSAQAKTRLRWVAALTPVPIALLMVVIFHSVMFLAFMLLGPLGMLAGAWDDRRHGRISTRQANKLYDEEVRRTTQSLRHDLEVERSLRRDRYPAPHTVHRLASARLTPQASWPVSLRLGHGGCLSMLRIKVDREHIEVPLADVPVGLELSAGSVTHIEASEQDVSAFLAQVAISLSVWGAPGATPCILTPALTDELELWIAETHFLDVRDDLPTKLRDALTGTAPFGSTHGASIVVVSAKSAAAQDIAANWRSQPDRALVWVGPQCPLAASATVRLRRGHLASSFANGQRFTWDTLNVPLATATAARIRGRSRAADAAATQIPEVVSPESVLRRGLDWSSPGTLKVPVGMRDSRVMEIDLRRDGPHMLVAGTTGAGKSEFLIAYLHGLLTLNSPEEVTVLLIDYKGGATFGPLASAPHVMGVISDLDAGLAERALAGLAAEIKRRERMLGDVGAASFEAFRDGQRPTDPSLARLFIVVDEFRVLAEELPEFVRGLVRLAAVGRSLGMHLILATQRPGGVVTPDIRANLDARVCLRVREKADSIDVIESPLAAAISRSTPGRAYFSVGGGLPIEFQSTWISAPGHSSDVLHVHAVRGEPFGCMGCAEEAANPKPDRLTAFVREAQDAARGRPPIHHALRAPLPSTLSAEVAAQIATHDVTWDALEAREPHISGLAVHEADTVAIVDLPAQQAQPVLGVPSAHIGIAGGPRTGRTAAARRIAELALKNGRPVNWISDEIDEAPQGATVIDINEGAEVERLLRELEDGDFSPETLLIVDGVELLQQKLVYLRHGLGFDDFIAALAKGHRNGVTVIATGSRLINSSKLTALLHTRVVLKHHDAADYSLAGLRPAQVPGAMPPGRGLVLPHGYETQFVQPAPNSGGCLTKLPEASAA